MSLAAVAASADKNFVRMKARFAPPFIATVLASRLGKGGREGKRRGKGEKGKRERERELTFQEEIWGSGRRGICGEEIYWNLPIPHSLREEGGEFDCKHTPSSSSSFSYIRTRTHSTTEPPPQNLDLGLRWRRRSTPSLPLAAGDG